MKKAYKRFIPNYTEISLFLASLTFFTLAIIDRSFSSYLLNFMGSFKMFYFWGALLYGSVLSIYYVFSPKEPPLKHKRIMLIFIILLTFIISLAGFALSFKEGLTFWIILPAINFLYSLFLFYLLKSEKLDEKSIKNGKARTHEIIIGAIFVILICTVSNFILNNHWVITFSLSMTYTSLINKAVTKVLFRE